MKLRKLQKGMKLKLGVVSIGRNKDLMFKYNGFCLFLKNYKDKPIDIGKIINLKVVKLFEKVGYVELD